MCSVFILSVIYLFTSQSLKSFLYTPPQYKNNRRQPVVRRSCHPTWSLPRRLGPRLLQRCRTWPLGKLGRKWESGGELLHRLRRMHTSSKDTSYENRWFWLIGVIVLLWVERYLLRHALMIGCLFSLDLLDSFSFVMLLIVCGTWIYIF